MSFTRGDDVAASFGDDQPGTSGKGSLVEILRENTQVIFSNCRLKRSPGSGLGYNKNVKQLNVPKDFKRRKMLLQSLIFFALLSLISSFTQTAQRIREHEELQVDIPAAGQIKLYYRVRDPMSALFVVVSPCGAPVHFQIYNMRTNVIPFGDITTSPALSLIYGQQKASRINFYTHRVLADRLLIVLSAPTSASARVFISTTQKALDEQYPPLPEDTRLGHAVAPQEQDASALISWKTSSKIRKAPIGKYRFCAVVSKTENEYAVCDHLHEGLESIHCVESDRNQMRIDKLRLGQQYFVSVFVRDSTTGAASSYSTLQLSIPSSTNEKNLAVTQKPSEAVVLQDGEFVQGDVPAGKGSLLGYDMSLDDARTAKRVLLVVHSCSGFIRVNIYRNGRLLKKSEVFSGFRRFLVLNPNGGRLRFEVINEERRGKTVRLWASSRPTQSPYPLLPDDTSVRVSRRTCQSTTLQWVRAPDDAIEYCLYKRLESARFLEHLVSKADDLCAGGLSSSLVGCYSPRGPRKGREVRIPDDSSAEEQHTGLIETRVDRLIPNTTYRFDLLARPINRSNSQFLPYRTVWVRTAKTC
ncbi:unnamed protein product, partial [Mesorhabditis belari]|uniref:Protein NDNF C-terminal domain-containing protein n=1 Tax=Mesorhabditis belari TaxID=2138241 RepID=A0AAF3FC72_9BILA